MRDGLVRLERRSRSALPFRGHLLLAALQVVLLVLGALAVSATACEGGGGGGAELTALATSLSGEGKEGEAITVIEGSKVKDKASLSGKNASKATGKVTYKVYSDKECKTLVTTAGEVSVSGESVPASSEEELAGGASYYWQAHYGGDAKNAESTSPCTEISTVKAKTAISLVLSGEGKEGTELTVVEGAKIQGKAKLSGTKSSTAGGTVTYKVFSDKECKTLYATAGEVTVSAGTVPASSEEALAAGTYYWQAIYSGDSLHQGSTSACGPVVHVEPPAPSIEQVDFKNNKEVVIDHRSNTAGEAALKINEFGEKNDVEWQLSKTPGDTKNWPVMLVRHTRPSLTTQFEISKGDEEFITKHMEAGTTATITGEYTLGGTALKLEGKISKAELEAHKGYFVTPEFEVTNSVLPNRVLYESATITWNWKLKETGQPAFEQQVGTSTHNFYLSYKAPLGSAKTFLTLLDIATSGIQAVNEEPTEAEALKGIWNEYATLVMHMRWYEVGPGTIDRFGDLLQYYEGQDTEDLNLEEIDALGLARCGLTGVEELLDATVGQCGAWADAFADTLAIEGIKSVLIKIQPQFGAAGEKCAVAGTCEMLVNSWKFEGAGTSGVPKFPYKASEVRDVMGAPAQSDVNPPATFSLHYVVEAPKGAKTLYDPSYGTGPMAGAEPLKEVQEKEIAGFCGPFNGAHETECQQAPAALQLVSSEGAKYE